MRKHSDFHRERTSTTTLKMMSNFASTTKQFNLGSSRVLFAQKKGSLYKLKMFEMGSVNRYVDFSIVRWASFVRAIDEVQNAIYEIHTNPQLKFRHHIGGGYYISVSADFKCVDIGYETDYFVLQKNSKCILKYFHSKQLTLDSI